MFKSGSSIRRIVVSVFRPCFVRSQVQSSRIRKFTCSSVPGNANHDTSHAPHTIEARHPILLLRQMSNLIQDFLKQTSLSSSDIHQFLVSNLSQFSSCHLITLHYNCSKQNILLDSEVIEILAEEFETRDDLFNVVDVTNSLYALKLYSSKSPEVRKLIVVLTRKIAQSTEAFGNQCIGNSLYGLQNCSSAHKEVRDLLKVLTNRIHVANVNLENRHISSMMFGLRYMNSNIWEVRNLVGVLAHKIEASSCLFGAQQVGNCLYGLQGMHCKHDEVRHMLQALKGKVSRCREFLQVQHIGNSLYGLRNMRSETLEVRELLGVLAPVIHKTKVGLGGQAVGTALLGLKGMSSDSPEVRNLLSALCDKMTFLKCRLSAQNICNALSGLRRMKSQHKEVLHLLTFLERGIFKSSGTADKLRTLSFTNEGICLALYGLRSMRSDSLPVQRVLNFVYNVMQQLRHEGSLHSTRHSSSLYSPVDISMAMSGLREMNLGSTGVRQVFQVLQEEFVVSQDQFTLQQLSLILRSLRHMDHTDSTVRSVLVVIDEKLSQLLENEGEAGMLKAEDISRALHAMKKMTNETVEVRRILGQLVRLMEKYTTQQKQNQSGRFYSAEDVILSLSGLENMSSSCDEVMNVVNSLASITVLSNGGTIWNDADKIQIATLTEGMKDPSGKAKDAIIGALLAHQIKE